MKKILLISFFLFSFTGFKLYAQDDDAGNEKIRDKMNEFIQQRLNLSKAEAEKFSPVFLRYFHEWRTTLRTTKDEPVLIREQKIVDLRLRYRDQFKGIIGDKRSNEVFDHQRTFIKEMRNLRQERLERNDPIRTRKNR
ncbi:MAG: hypothetical protein JST09_08280 [Bacteroidetes bacterium]|nr:hypothetical protein [Bacteroidota bacterium]MBS1609481.1 hypothetical protein [Bacteroidota bacterium]